MFFPVYDPPENSTFTKRISYEIIDLVENYISKYSHEGNIMIAGLILLKRDIIYKRKNCTRGRCYIPLDSDKHIPLFSTYKFDARIVGRVSQDTTVNSRGRQLLPDNVQNNTDTCPKLPLVPEKTQTTNDHNDDNNNTVTLKVPDDQITTLENCFFGAIEKTGKCDIDRFV